MTRAFTPAAGRSGARLPVQRGTDMLFEMIPAYLRFFSLPVATRNSCANWRKFATESLAARLIYRSVSGRLAAITMTNAVVLLAAGSLKGLYRRWHVSISKAVFWSRPILVLPVYCASALKAGRRVRYLPLPTASIPRRCARPAGRGMSFVCPQPADADRPSHRLRRDDWLALLTNPRASGYIDPGLRPVRTIPAAV